MNDTPFPAFGILLVDDEPAWLRSLSLTLESSAGVTNLFLCQDSREVLPLLEKGGIGLALLDLTMPGLSGEELLAGIAERHPDVAVIIISGVSQLDTAVRCMRLGAFDYYVKTDDEDRIVSGVVRAIRMIELREENRAVASSLSAGTLAHPEAFAGIVTRSRAMFSVFAYIEAVAKSSQPLLVTGESGVGKENIVRAVHAVSGREGPFVAVNVAGLDDTVFADTLFGHVRGAYTGAEAPRKGMIEEAAGGTLFLDEIGDLSVACQVKLLRLLQEGEYFALGSDLPKRLRARVVVATHRDLAAEEAAGRFRRDLYYRLRTHQTRIPPLRDRREDLEPLARHFAAEAARAMDKPVPALPRELAACLAGYAFPGNIRELRAMIFDAVSLTTGPTLALDGIQAATGHGEACRDDVPANLFAGCERLPTFIEAADLLVTEAMARAGGNQTLAARLLGISQPALSKRLKSRRDAEGGD
ncbi:sigma-54-dependent transcriptional regulator [Desulfovibrio sp. TomC]|uniref:sigma-54-dependent transcriptional regulator n=1 Tax=Desulfovibrio sp. TomC TaxID=1562888 RepID=UPI0005754661|nr:sigma-54 dependent transcriptional regulator [Desulfovibrio sp. TomC]KHK02664.1 Sigma-54 dependent DNA-binding response regulator [Desulfovibrio sp. TomC]